MTHQIVNSHSTLILSGYGLNCEVETAHACQLASGGQMPTVAHWSDLLGRQHSVKRLWISGVDRRFFRW